ncbi:MAG TPA: ABC transporter ATP-binding protein [Candidatus Limnocylindria bacterium]|jgi:lipoprotein-releasing system ATP-binding protein|nr:ABC transporter ATP-binding protein [Candidatus Limnocylindria bacterium]
MSAAAPLLELRAISKSYPGPVPVPVLRDASLTVTPGESVAIIGPSGCGKSTVLNLLGTLDLPDSGSLTFEGRDLTKLSAKELAAFRNRQIGFIFQNHHLLPQCNVLENVLLPTLADAKRAPAEAEARARKLLDRVGLGARLDHLPGKLSGGERQRAAVVRALINQPALLLADEPTGALDRTSATGIGQLLVELNREEGVTLIVVTHSPELAALMGRTVELRDGQFVEKLRVTSDQ